MNFGCAIDTQKAKKPVASQQHGDGDDFKEDQGSQCAGRKSLRNDNGFKTVSDLCQRLKPQQLTEDPGQETPSYDSYPRYEVYSIESVSFRGPWDRREGSHCKHSPFSRLHILTLCYLGL